MENWTVFPADETFENSRPLVERIFEMLILTIILIISVFGNGCICYLILRDPRLKRASYIYIFNLAITDFGLSVTSVPISIAVSYHDKFVFSYIICEFNGLIMLIFGIASLINLAVIAVTRYVCVCHSTFAKTYLNKTFYIGSVISIWVASLLIAFPPAVGWGHIEFVYGYTACTHYWPSSLSYTLFLITSAVFIPFGIIIISYGLLFWCVRKSNLRVRDHMEQSAFKRSDLKLAKVSLSVFVSFMICWVPISVTNFLLLAGYQVPNAWNMFAIILMYSNSLCNPVIYSLMSSDFRNGFRRVFCGCLKPSSNSASMDCTLN